MSEQHEQSTNPLDRERLIALGRRIEEYGNANSLFSNLISSDSFNAESAKDALSKGIIDQGIRDRYLKTLDAYSQQRQTADKIWEFAAARRVSRDSVGGGLAKMFCEYVTGDPSGEDHKWGKVTVSRTDVTVHIECETKEDFQYLCEKNKDMCLHSIPGYVEGMQGSTLRYLALEFYGNERYTNVITAEWKSPDTKDPSDQSTKIHERSHMLRKSYEQGGLVNAIGQNRGERRVYDEFDELDEFILTMNNVDTAYVGYLNKMSLSGENKRIKSGQSDTMLTDELLAYIDGADKPLTEDSIADLIHPSKYNCALFIDLYYELYKEELKQTPVDGVYQIDLDQMTVTPFTQSDKDEALSKTEKTTLEQIQKVWDKQIKVVKEGFSVFQRMTEKYKDPKKVEGMLLPFPTRYWKAVERIMGVEEKMAA